MKTHETEKHNIPEGATHYSNEDLGSYFCWYSVSDKAAEICVLDGIGFGHKWHKCSNEHKGINVKPIPQAKKVEWVNGLPPVGVECVFTPHNMQWGFNHIEDFTGKVLHYEGEQFVFMLNHAKYKLEGDMVVVSRTDKGDFSKPETQEDRERLERANEIYDMCANADIFTEDSHFWATKFYDLGYRKGGE